MTSLPAQDCDIDAARVFEDVGTLEEARYLLEHLMNLAITRGLYAAQKDTQNKELEARAHQQRMSQAYERQVKHETSLRAPGKT